MPRPMTVAISNSDGVQIGCKRQPMRTQDSPEGNEISETTLTNQVVGRWYDAGVRASEKALAIASRAGVSHQFLGVVQKGQKAVSPKLIVALFEDRAAWMAFADAVSAELHPDLAPMRAKRKVRKDEAEKAVARQAKQLGLVWRAMREAAAADLGTSPDDLEAALESEST